MIGIGYKRFRRIGTAMLHIRFEWDTVMIVLNSNSMIYHCIKIIILSEDTKYISWYYVFFYVEIKVINFTFSIIVK
jgi:hypothetical protein